MSGICGVIYFNQQKVTMELDAMIATLQHRGPNGIEVWQEANVGLAHLMMHITPESINETQPVVDNNLILVADARIDNRQELTSTLSLDPNATDSAIVMAAYKYWGTDLANRLIGDFVVVIWDIEKQQIFCLRDHVGARPLYYVYKSGEFFAFASEMKALLTLDGISTALNQTEVAAYLSSLSDFRYFTGRTIYQEITSLKPAHWIVINKQGLKEQFYWDLNLYKFDHLKTDDDFVRAFREVFIEAVRCRIRTPFEVASHLSGGLDSSSISAVANQILEKENRAVHTFHMDVEVEKCNEKDYAEALLTTEQLKNQHQYTKINDVGFYEAIEAIHHITDRPNSFVVTPPAQLGWMKAAEKVSARVFLTGHEGDTVVDYGFDLFEETLLAGDYKTFELLLSQYSQYAIHYNYPDDISAWTMNKKEGFVRQNVLRPILGTLRKGKNYRKMLSVFLNTKGGGRLVYNLLSTKIRDQNIIKASLKRKNIDARFSILATRFKTKTNIEQVGVAETTNADPAQGLTEAQQKHFKKMRCFGMVQFCEILEHCGVHHGFKIAHPFLDKRVLELALVLPTKLNFNNGMMRGTIREAMRGILPEKIRTRTIKMDFSPLLLHTLQHTEPNFEDIFSRQTRSNNTNQYLNHAELMNRTQICKNPSLSCPNELKYSLMHQIFRSLYFQLFFNNLNNFNYEKSTVPKSNAQPFG